MYFIIGIICIISILIIFIMNISYKKKIEEKYKIKRNLDEEQYKKEIEEKKKEALQEYEEYCNTLEISKKQLELSTNSAKGQIDSVLDAYRRERKEKIEQELSIQYSERNQQYNNEFIKKSKQIDDEYSKAQIELKTIQSQLDDYSKKLSQTIDAVKRATELEEKQDFYRFKLPSSDIEDIDCLKTIEPHLNNKEILNRLIFDAYYKKPLADLTGRILGDTNPSGIYKITNLKNKRYYIGRSVNVKDRWQQHIKTSLGIGTIARSKIHDAIKEDGIQNFTFELLEEVPKDKLNEREKYWIKFFQSDTFGYNENRGG